MLKLKNVLIAALALILGMGALFITAALSDAGEVRKEVLRFHVIANSDSEKDQALKLKVRDGIAELTSSLFSDVSSKAEAAQIAEQNKEEIAQKAKEILLENGVDSAVKVSLGERFFPTKHYGNISLPAGKYDALCIEIGKAKGQNFWCVMFPSLCIAPASQIDDKQNAVKMDAVLSESAMDMVLHPSSVKFKVVEWYRCFCKWFQ